VPVSFAFSGSHALRPPSSSSAVAGFLTVVLAYLQSKYPFNQKPHIHKRFWKFEIISVGAQKYGTRNKMLSFAINLFCGILLDTTIKKLNVSSIKTTRFIDKNL